MLNEFITALEQVAAIGEQVTALETSATAGEAAILNTIIAKVVPIMRYLDSPVRTHASHSGHQAHEWEYTHHKEHGIVLVDGFVSQYTDHDYRGDYTGDCLVLTRSGSLVVLERSGQWSNWQNEESFWTAIASEVTAEQAVTRCDIEAIIKGLVDAFRQAIENAHKKQTFLGLRLRLLENMQTLFTDKKY